MTTGSDPPVGMGVGAVVEGWFAAVSIRGVLSYNTVVSKKPGALMTILVLS